RGHASRDRGRLQPGPHRHEIAELFRLGGERRCNDPGILAALAGRQKYPEISKCVGSLCHLTEIIQIDRPSSDGGAEITAVAVGRKEPQDIGNIGRAHVPAFLTASAMVILVGMSLSA